MRKDTSTKSNQIIDTQLQALLEEVNIVRKEIDAINNDVNTKFSEINSRTNELVTDIEKIYSELDQIEKRAGDELDKLILQQAETLAKK